MKKILFFVVITMSFFTACKKDELATQEVPTSKTEFASGTSNSGFTFKLYRDDRFRVGYNKLYMKVLDANNQALKQHDSISFSSLMDMGAGMQHSSPVEKPLWNESLQLYEGGVVFSMPSSMGKWMMFTTINTEGIFIDMDTVTSNPDDVMSTVVGTDGNTYVLTMIQPKVWKVGLNDIDIFITQKVSSMSFPTVNNLTIEMTPEMPSMGHGSPNNISPTFTKNGHYVGKANFTMTGDWRLHITLKSNGVTLSDAAYFDLMF